MGEIDIEEFSAHHGATKDLSDRATSKDFLNLFIDDDYLDEIVRYTIAYARSKGDETFTTSCAEISAYLGLNIYMGIHSLPQIDMFWDSDIFVGVEGFKKTIPKQRFSEHWADIYIWSTPVTKIRLASSAKFNNIFTSCFLTAPFTLTLFFILDFVQIPTNMAIIAALLFLKANKISDVKTMTLIKELQTHGVIQVPSGQTWIEQMMVLLEKEVFTKEKVKGKRF